VAQVFLSPHHAREVAVLSAASISVLHLTFKQTTNNLANCYAMLAFDQKARSFQLCGEVVLLIFISISVIVVVMKQSLMSEKVTKI
jgi:hypothetical protein